MENKQRDQAGSGREENQHADRGMGYKATNDENTMVSGPDNDHESLPSDGPVSEAEGDDRKPDLDNIEKNQEDEPGVPDQDF